MRLCRIDGRDNPAIPCVVIDGQVYSSAGAGLGDYNSAFFGEGLLAELVRFVQAGKNLGNPLYSLADLLSPAHRHKLLSPTDRAPNIPCIGLNYGLHADEAGMPRPKSPVVFFKHTGSWSSPFGNIVLPSDPETVDYEVELVAMIGKAAHNVPQAEALNHVAGYMVTNDVSHRRWQLEVGGGQWGRGKGCPTFSPMGPVLVTADEVPDPQNLRLWSTVNGEARQDSNTSDMIFSVAEIISQISANFGLLPGDVICTGTPFNVGMSYKPPKYLNAGDVVVCGIDGIGEIENEVVSA